MSQHKPWSALRLVVALLAQGMALRGSVTQVSADSDSSNVYPPEVGYRSRAETLAALP